MSVRPKRVARAVAAIVDTFATQAPKVPAKPATMPASTAVKVTKPTRKAAKSSDQGTKRHRPSEYVQDGGDTVLPDGQHRCWTSKDADMTEYHDKLWGSAARHLTSQQLFHQVRFLWGSFTCFLQRTARVSPGFACNR